MVGPFCMRLTYTDLKNQFLDNTGNTGSTDTDILSFFKRSLGERYQLMLAEFADYQGQIAKTASTVANQQYYAYPPGIVDIEDVVITVGSLNYPLEAVGSQARWDSLNAVLIQSGAIPQYFFPRRDDFGIWPIPQDVYTITLNYHWRDRNLTNDDYTTGTVSVTNGSATITGSGTTWTAAMVGRWFTATDGLWYRIAGFTNSTTLTLATNFAGATASSLSYTIGESPELPEEAHTLLATGVTADYYMGYRKDAINGKAWTNKFWTGDPGIALDTPPDNIYAGFIGLKKRFASRADRKVVRRSPRMELVQDKRWASSITNT